MEEWISCADAPREGVEQPLQRRKGGPSASLPSWNSSDVFLLHHEKTTGISEMNCGPEEIEEAAWWVDDAMNLRFQNGMGMLLRNKASRRRIRLFIIQNDWRFKYLVLLSMSIQCFLNFYEECGTTDGKWQQGSPAVLTLEAVCLLIPILDILMKVSYMTWKPYYKKWWHRAYMATITLQVANLLVTAVGLALPGRRFPLARPMRIFRPVSLLIREHNMREVLVTIGRLFVVPPTKYDPKLPLYRQRWEFGVVPVMLGEILIFVMIWVGVGVHFYSQAYDEHGKEGGLGSEQKAFANPFRAFLRLFILLSNENFSSLLYPVLPCDNDDAYEGSPSIGPTPSPIASSSSDSSTGGGTGDSGTTSSTSTPTFAPTKVPSSGGGGGGDGGGPGGGGGPPGRFLRGGSGGGGESRGGGGGCEDDEYLAAQEVSWAYFVSFTFLATFVITNVLFARLIQFYMDAQKAQVESDRYKQRKALVQAFKVLDQKEVGHVNFVTWCHLFEHMRHIGLITDGDWNYALLHFDLLDREENEYIDCIDFLFIESCLNLQIRKRETTMGCFGQLCCNFKNEGALARVQQYLLQGKVVSTWKRIASGLIFFGMVTNLVWWRSMSDGAKNIVAWVTLSFSIACGIEIGAFAFFLNTPLRGTQIFASGWMKDSPRIEIDAICATASVIFAALVVVMGPTDESYYRMLWLSPCLNAVRIQHVSEAAGAFIKIMTNVISFVTPLICTCLMIMHVFAYLGTRLFCNSNKYFGSTL